MVGDTTSHERYRQKNGKIGKKHGDTLVRTLRKIYGVTFGPGCRDFDHLSDVLDRLDEPSLSKLVRDHERGHLAERIMKA